MNFRSVSARFTNKLHSSPYGYGGDFLILVLHIHILSFHAEIFAINMEENAEILQY